MDLKVALILTSCLISQGRCLMCHNCLPDDTGFCHDVQGPCPEECASVRVASYIDGRKQGVMNLKTCSQSDMCIVGSINFGTSRVKVENTCCSTHLCNGKTPPESREDISNANRCYTCRNGDCSSTVECLGDEDRCVTSIATGQVDTSKNTIVTDEEGRSTGIQKGCASMSICQQRDSSSLFLADVADQLICCEGQLCNDGTVATTNHNAGNLAHLTRSNRHILLAMVAVSVYGFQ